MYKIHKEGYPTIFYSTLILVSINFILFYFIEKSVIKELVLVLSFFIVTMLIYFFRNPKIKPTLDNNLIVSSADGKIVTIKKVYEGEYFNEERIQVSIFLSVLNVHLNRYPLGGIVKYSKYHPGKYLVAFHPKSSSLNERTSIVVENDTFGSILFRQIAGLLARRIVNYSEVGKDVKQSDEQGFIKFGSRMDLFLPLNSELLVSKGDKVKAGITPIAKSL